MAAITRIDAAMDMFVKRSMRDFHTNIRAKVVDVDYSIPSATVKPMATTEFDDGTTEEIPAIYDVPLSMPSANGGKAGISFPVKAGDIVGLSFSERNEGDTSDVSTHGLYGGWAITCLYESGSTMPIDEDNVEVWNDKIKISMTPEGVYTLTNSSATMTIAEDGTMTYDNGSATISVNTDGTIVMNGGTVTADGNFITKNGTNLDDFYSWFKEHTHAYTWTDPAGNGDTDAPNAE